MLNTYMHVVLSRSVLVLVPKRLGRTSTLTLRMKEDI